jgi:HK97 family phage prohead protease
LAEYEKNPVVLFGHRHDQPPIGRATGVKITENGLEAVTEFPPIGTYPFADTVFELNRLGYLKSWSVGFVPKKHSMRLGEEQQYLGRTFEEQTLLEYSSVPVPANIEAVNLAVSKGIVNVAALELLGWNKPAPPEKDFFDNLQNEFSKQTQAMMFETESHRLALASRHAIGRRA